MAGCSSDGKGESSSERAGTSPGVDLPIQVDAKAATAKATFKVEPGTEEVTVTGAKFHQRLSLVDDAGKRLVILKADKYGQAHFTYLPTKLAEYQTGAKGKLPTSEGYIVKAGKGYTVRLEDTSPPQVSEPFEVLGKDDKPEPAFFEGQAGKIGPTGSESKWFGYAPMRDGVELSINVRLPGPADKGPYPTVIEYSGYGPANPDATEPGSMIAGLLGFATVGVNMRGTGCSGGVFDTFNDAQQVDGYDIVEDIAHQPWVKGNKVGMVGLSYSGITQLYVAATRPPSLAAVTPLSVIKDPWLQQWPGGVYNGGFTRQWLSERDKESSAGGTSWVGKRIKGGDKTCAANQKLREQNIDFEAFGRSLVHRPELADGRDLSKLVSNIDVPVFMSGAWQDEQTGPQFADMLGNFTNSPDFHVMLFNGRHPDGYTPEVLSHWLEFLQLYVAKQVPHIDPAIRSAAPPYFEDSFHAKNLQFSPDEYAAFYPANYDGALAQWKASPKVRVLFERGASDAGAGSPVSKFGIDYTAWPPPGTNERSFYLGADGSLADAKPTKAGADRFANEPAYGSQSFFAKKDGYGLLDNTWDFNWKPAAKGKGLSYVSPPLTDTTVLGGPGYVELYVKVPDGDADVQASLNIIRADGTEWHVTTGLLRLSDRKTDPATTKGLQVDRTYSATDSASMPAGKYVPVKIALPSFAQAFRPGDRVHLEVSSPGRDFAAWAFTDIGKAGTPRDVAFGGSQASRLVVGVLPGFGPGGTTVPDNNPPCPSLRGQACRQYQAVANTSAP